MRTQDLFLAANEHLVRVVAAIGEEQWDLAMPEHASFSPSDLRMTIGYHAYDDAWVPDVLAGRSAEDVGTAFDYLRELKQPRDAYFEHCARASAAVREFADLERTAHLSYGTYTAREFLQHITSFRAIRTYDIARLIGVDPAMTPEFLEGLEEEYAPLIDEYRGMGVFPAAKSVPPDADAQTRVMAMFGRD